MRFHSQSAIEKQKGIKINPSSDFINFIALTLTLATKKEAMGSLHFVRRILRFPFEFTTFQCFFALQYLSQYPVQFRSLKSTFRDPTTWLSVIVE